MPREALRIFTANAPTSAAGERQSTGLSGGGLAVWQLSPYVAGALRIGFSQPGNVAKDFVPVREGDRFLHNFKEVWLSWDPDRVDNALQLEQLTPHVVLLATVDPCELPARPETERPFTVFQTDGQGTYDLGLASIEVNLIALSAANDWMEFNHNHSSPDSRLGMNIRAEADKSVVIPFPSPVLLHRDDGATHQWVGKSGINLTESRFFISYRPSQI